MLYKTVARADEGAHPVHTAEPNLARVAYGALKVFVYCVFIFINARRKYSKEELKRLSLGKGWGLIFNLRVRLLLALKRG